jgi:organic radical activating enzyme
LTESLNLVEVFSSVQGEGTHVGESTLFLRFGGCDLRCGWCDSPGTWRRAKTCRIETERGAGGGRRVPNPVSLADALAAADALELTAHRWASLTGGEPLLQASAAEALARALRARGARVYLETHGLASDALQRLVDAVDLVSMDWKLSSDVRRAEGPRAGIAAEFHEAHAAFLRVARAAPEVLVKVVVTPATRDQEIDRMAACIAAVEPTTPVVLQPVTPFGAVREGPAPGRLLALVARLSRSLPDVRLIPQTHKLYGAL